MKKIIFLFLSLSLLLCSCSKSSSGSGCGGDVCHGVIDAITYSFAYRR